MLKNCCNSNNDDVMLNDVVCNFCFISLSLS